MAENVNNISRSFADNVNYLAELDNQYYKTGFIKRNGINVDGSIHRGIVKLNVFDLTSKEHKNIEIYSADINGNADLINFFNNMKNTIIGLYPDVSINVSIVDGTNIIPDKNIDIQISSTNTILGQITVSIHTYIGLDVADYAKYTLTSGSENYIAVLPYLSQLDDSFNNAILSIGENSSEIVNVSNNINSVTTVSSSINNVNTNALNIDSINTNASNITNINNLGSRANDIDSIVSNVIPNLAEILLADDNATIATRKASEASASEASALSSKNSASTSESNAFSYMNSASQYKDNALASANNALLSEQNAASSETNASNSELNASISELNALTYRNETEVMKLAIETIYDTFDDRYLGAYATDPTVDNDGDALIIGTIYFNTTDNRTKFYNGVAWEDPELTSTEAAQVATTKANEASISAANALVSEQNAANSESAASLSESNALSSANTATTQAGIATTKAGESAASASASASSASNSATSASNSAASASASAVSASAALASENAASMSEDNAASSASSSASSATASANSASASETSRIASVAAQTAAEVAQTASETAQGLAEAAKDEATVQAGIATTKANESAVSAANAGISEDNALASKNTAALSESNANASANAALISQQAAALSETNASTSEANAASSASVAATSEGNALDSAQAAATSAASASVSAGNALTSENNALVSANNAASSESLVESYKLAAEAAKAAAEASADFVDDLYLGSKTSDPTVDNDGNPIQVGAIYYNSTTEHMRVYTGSVWNRAVLDASGAVLSFNNRTGLVTLTSSDVTEALGFTPEVADVTILKDNSVHTITNKVIDDVSNIVGANHIHYKVKAAETLAKGDIVYISGYNSGEDATEVRKVNRNQVAVGIVDSALVAGDFGTCINTGMLEGIDTSMFTFGTILYVTASGWSTAKPTTAYQAAGIVMRSNANNGALLVEFTEPVDSYTIAELGTITEFITVYEG